MKGCIYRFLKNRCVFFLAIKLGHRFLLLFWCKRSVASSIAYFYGADHFTFYCGLGKSNKIPKYKSKRNKTFAMKTWFGFFVVFCMDYRILNYRIEMYNRLKSTSTENNWIYLQRMRRIRRQSWQMWKKLKNNNKQWKICDKS